VPDVELGRDVSGGTSFETSEQSVDAGTIVIEVGDVPLFVEEE